jgi:outer membrane protein assembly factor BamE (lipoprotein component of BamABCDE complex)
MKRALIGLPIAFLATACVHAASMDEVHAGMERSQVTAMLGPPETTNNTAGQECAYYSLTKDFWSRVPWDMTDRYYVCFTDGKVETFGKADRPPTSG